MDDTAIVALYWDRSEQALTETANKYGSYLTAISRSILPDPEDVKECVNDTYYHAWNTMPPHRPSLLNIFLGKITRRVSIDRWRQKTALKRGGGEFPLALSELEDCVSGSGDIEGDLVRRELVDCINAFLAALPKLERQVFLCRYWYMDSIPSIAGHFGCSVSKITSMLHRTRKKLRARLEQEGYA